MSKPWCIPGRPLPNGAGWRVWFALEGAGGPPALELRELTSDALVATTVEYFPIASPPGFDRRIVLADLKLDAPRPGAAFRIAVPELALSGIWSTLPGALSQDGLAVLLASCFYVQDDKTGHYANAVDKLLRGVTPRAAFKILMGDQLYLDWPASPFSGAVAATAERYGLYWGNEAYRRALFACPNFVVCDDHEFWNNYPEYQVHLSRSHDQASRDQWGGLAAQYLDAFQLALQRANPGASSLGQPWLEIAVPPVSFFLLDTRSQRKRRDGGAHDRRVISVEQEQALRAWQQGLTGPGFLVLGQPPFLPEGDWRDYTLANFRPEFDAIMAIVEDSLHGRNAEGRAHDIVLVSGDIHTARHVRAGVAGLGDRKLHELVTSPASRVGPHTSSPEPESPPGRLEGRRPDGTAMRWTPEGRPGVERMQFAHVDNNVALLTLRRSTVNTYGVEARFAVYRVRPAQQPFWKFWADDAPDPGANPGTMLMYETTLYLE